MNEITRWRTYQPAKRRKATGMGASDYRWNGKKYTKEKSGNIQSLVTRSG